MRALVCRDFGPVENLVVAELDRPTLGEGEVRVAVKAAGLNFPDGLVVQGEYQLRPELPFAPGSEFSGIITEVSGSVTDFSAGDRVFGLTSFGAFAEEVVVPANRLNRMDSEIGFVEAAVLSMAYGAAMYALFDRGGLKADQSVLILGATGGVGLAAVELAALAGARVLAVDGDDARLREATTRGATDAWNYHQGSLRDAANQFTGKAGFDLILDPVGGSLGEEAVRCLAWKGRLLVFGFASGSIPKIATNLLLLKGAEVAGVFWGESHRRGDNNDRENYARLLQWRSEGKIAPHVSRKYSLAEGAKAIQALLDREITGKAVIIVDGET